MRKIFFLILATTLLLLAKDFRSVAVENGEFVKKEDKFYCSNCGMHLPTYYKTNHVHEGDQYCSIHCLYGQTQKSGIPKNAKVVDTKSLKLIDAKNAFYVIGSKKPATMSRQSKYAFANEVDAQNFIKENGGALVDFKTAYEAAAKDFENDNKMLQTKREKMVYKSGKKLYESKCEKIDVAKFESIDKLKTALSNSCKTKMDKELQAISVYLWDTQKLKKEERNISPLAVPKDAKCPICGMFVAKYPQWAVKIEYKGEVHYFDGPKDMLKYVYKKGIKDNSEVKITVTDYFTTNAVDGRKAFFVSGSDVYGPMGKDLVAFESDDAAFNFKNEHFGMRVLKYNEITEELFLYLK